MKKNKTVDPYIYSEESVKEAPEKFFRRLKYIGPGLVLSASIVGSGELIATTALGAKAGFIMLWIIIVSCLVKVALQVEFGKHTIITGETTMTALNKLPGPKFRNVHWTIWAWLLVYFLQFFQMGGIIGGVGQALNITVPGVSVNVWLFVTAVSAALLVYSGRYRLIQNASVMLIFFFTLFNLLCVAMLQYTPYAIDIENILSGLSFQMPGYAVIFAVSAFGLTGVGGDEIMQYPYWCIEKGYALYTGSKQDSPEWRKRAKGWIRIMYMDAVFSMVVYTVVTVSFYLLGAAVLYGRGEIPEGYEMIEILSRMYTETIGSGAKYIFLAGSVIVLFSTAFSCLAAWSRTFGDAFGRLGLIDYFDSRARKKFIAVFAWVVPVIWAVLYILIKEPVSMVALGGVGTAVFLLVVVYVGFYFRYRRLSKDLYPGIIYDVLLWISGIVILAVGIKALWSGITELLISALFTSLSI